MSIPRRALYVCASLLLWLASGCAGEHGASAVGVVDASLTGAAVDASDPAPAGPVVFPAPVATQAAGVSVADPKKLAIGPLRVLVLAGGGFHEFASNLALLLPGVDGFVPCAFTTQWLGPMSPSGPPPALTGPLDGRTDLTQLFDVILAYTQGDLDLTLEQRQQFLQFVSGGGGFVGLHCAVDSHPDWPEYIAMCGAQFLLHPPFGPIHVSVDATPHPITAGLPTEWDLSDEFYHLQGWVPGAQTQLMSGISPLGGDPRPVTWCKPYGQGRVACTILGHGPQTHGDPRYQQLVAQALRWAGRH